MLEELHLMLDLETLSTHANTVVVEVGWALFETQANTVNDSGVWSLILQEQIDNRRHVSADTLVNFWLSQPSQLLQDVFKKQPKVTVEMFLDEFKSQIPWHNIQGVWSHGLNFDIPILEDLHRRNGRILPWHYRTPRDTRTLFWLAGMTSADLVKAEQQHSAQHDAIAQALDVQRAFKRMEDKIRTMGIL